MHRGSSLSQRSQSIAKTGVRRGLLVGAYRAAPRCPRVAHRRPRVFLRASTSVPARSSGNSLTQRSYPTRSGSRRDKDNINARVIRPGVRRANERRALRDLPPLPARVTAHTLRRTYISMMFAAGAEIPYVMAQVGHGDSKVTLEIYAQVLKRRDREQIGRAFDHLLVGGGRGEPRTRTSADRRAAKRSKTAARRGRNPG
jgi:integrase